MVIFSEKGLSLFVENHLIFLDNLTSIVYSVGKNPIFYTLVLLMFVFFEEDLLSHLFLIKCKVVE